MKLPTHAALRLALAASALLCLTALVAPLPTAAAPKAKPHLHFRTAYAEALLEARIRNVPILVSRHKDE